MKKQFLLLPILSMLFAACDEDFFEQTVSIDLPEHTPKLAVTAHFAAGDTTLRIFITHTLGVLDNSLPDTIANATAEVLKDGQPLAVLPHAGGAFYKTWLPGPLTATPSEYRMTVDVAGYDPVEAVQTMPGIVPILLATYEVEGAVDENGEKVDELTVEFQDPPGEDNYYAIRAWVLYDNGFKGAWYLDNLDPLAEDFGDDLVIKDDSFDGKKYKWRFSTYNFSVPGTSKMLLQLRSITKDKYLFLKSVNLYENNEDNPFAEPVIIHSNMTGGEGIFSLEAYSEVEIEL